MHRPVVVVTVVELAVVVDVVSTHELQSTGQASRITAENPAWVQSPTSTPSHDSGSGSPLQTGVVVVVAEATVVVVDVVSAHVPHKT